VLREFRRDLAPDAPLLADVPLPRGVRESELLLEVLAADGRVLVAYSPEPARDLPIPDPAREIPPPRELATQDELYFAGRHLEQYRHATRDPEDYHREALRRDPRDARANHALGLLLLRRGCCADAEPFLRAALATETRHNPNPSDGATSYALGLCLALSGRDAEAYDAFYKAVWSGAWQHAGYLELARVAARRGELTRALEHVERSLELGVRDALANHVRAILLRRLGRLADAEACARAALARDPLDFGAANELVLLARARGETKLALRLERELATRMRGSAHTYLRVADDYAEAGAYDDARALLARGGREATRDEPLDLVPLLHYASGAYAERAGDAKAAKRAFRAARKSVRERCFPNALAEQRALEAALASEPSDARAAELLANLYYDKRRRREAIALWERARSLDPRRAALHRNLAIAYFNVLGDARKALRSLERAARLAPDDARILYELDLVRQRLGVAPRARHAALARLRSVVEQRDDLVLELATLENTLLRPERALALLSARRFHPWEGGEGKVTAQWVIALLELARAALRAGEPDRALALLEKARAYPPNLGEGKLHGTPENAVLYHVGQAHAQRRDPARARAAWREAARGEGELAPPLYYNDKNPEARFFQGLALRRLGQEARATACFCELADYERLHAHDPAVIPYFAVSLPDFAVFDVDLSAKMRVHARFLRALGELGLGAHARALRDLRRVLALDPNHQAARLHLAATETDHSKST
jgi:tetratricopeptide (TPR) repeat protein